MAQNANKQQWEIELENKVNSAVVECKTDKNKALELFLQCVELETSNTDIIHKRFYSMKHILLLKSEERINEENIKILNQFKQFLSYYDADPMNTSFEYISCNDVNNTLRLFFNSLRDNNNINILIKLLNVACDYFENINVENDELLQMNIESTLKLLQKEYMNKLQMKYIANIQKCDEYDLWNAINDFENKLVVDIGSTQEQFIQKHINYAVHIDICKESDEQQIFDTLFNHIKQKRNPELYVYLHTKIVKDTDELKTDHHDTIKQIQHLLWRNTKRIIPCYICKHDFHTLSTKYYPFLCESGVNDRYIACDKQRQCGYANHIINDRLYLGNLKQATNNEILSRLKITHIVNCTPIDYNNHITKTKDKYLQIKVNDTYYADIGQHFERAYKFIEEALQDSENKVLVHCRSGMSRSASIIIAYIMKKRNMNVNDAFCFVKSKRSKVQPNGGFMQQLQKYHTLLRKQCKKKTV